MLFSVCILIYFRSCPITAPKWDLARYRHLFGSGRGNSESERTKMFKLVKNVWKPDANYDFPWSVISERKRRFQLQWLNKYKGLIYSHAEDGTYCLPCTLFSSGEQRGGLVGQPFRNWKMAIAKFDRHFHGKSDDKTKGKNPTTQVDSTTSKSLKVKVIGQESRSLGQKTFFKVANSVWN